MLRLAWLLLIIRAFGILKVWHEAVTWSLCRSSARQTLGSIAGKLVLCSILETSTFFLASFAIN